MQHRCKLSKLINLANEPTLISLAALALIKTGTRVKVSREMFEAAHAVTRTLPFSMKVSSSKMAPASDAPGRG